MIGLASSQDQNRFTPLIPCTLILIAKPFETHIQVNRELGRTMMIHREQIDSDRIWEPQMPSIWLVQDTKAFGMKGKTSDRDRLLSFRLSYQEWLAIYLDALGLHRSGYEKWAGKTAGRESSGAATVLTEIEEEIPGFPLLSRVRGPYHDVVSKITS